MQLCLNAAVWAAAEQNGFSGALPQRRSAAGSSAAAPLPRYGGPAAGGGVRWVARDADLTEVQAICRAKVGATPEQPRM
jgi:hypothetical protein